MHATERRELFEDGSSVFVPKELGSYQVHDEEVTRESLNEIGLHQAVHGALILCFERIGELKVQKICCETCIYKPNSPFDLNELEQACRDNHGHFFTYRACHSHWPKNDVCCAGFYHTNGDDCTPLQIAKRFGGVEFVE